MLWLIPGLWTGWTPQLGLMVKDSFPVPQNAQQEQFLWELSGSPGNKRAFQDDAKCQCPRRSWVWEGERKHVRDRTRRTCDLATLAKPQDPCSAQLARMAYALPHGESGWCMAQSQLKPRATTASYWQLPARSFWMSRSAINPPVLAQSQFLQIF